MTVSVVDPWTIDRSLGLSHGAWALTSPDPSCNCHEPGQPELWASEVVGAEQEMALPAGVCGSGSGNALACCVNLSAPCPCSAPVGMQLQHSVSSQSDAVDCEPFA